MAVAGDTAILKQCAMAEHTAVCCQYFTSLPHAGLHKLTDKMRLHADVQHTKQLMRI